MSSTQKSLLVGLPDRLLRAVDGAVVAVPNEDVAVVRARRPPRNDGALDDRVRVALDEALVVVGAGVALLAVDQHVLVGAVGTLQEAPFDAGGEGRAAAPAQAGGLDLIDKLHLGHGRQRLGEPTVAARREVLADVARVHRAAVARGDADLQPPLVAVLDARDAVDRPLAERAEHVAALAPATRGRGVEDGGNLLRRHVAVEDARAAGRLHVHQRLRVAEANAADLLDGNV